MLTMNVRQRPVVVLDESAELLAAFDRAFRLRREVEVENMVADVHSSVRSSLVTISGRKPRIRLISQKRKNPGRWINDWGSIS